VLFKRAKKGINCEVRPKVKGCYSFEKPRKSGIGRSRHPGDKVAQQDLAVFKARLGLDEHANLIKRQLEDFVVQHHSNIRWYDRQIFREEMWRRGYFFCNLAMLALIPALTFGVTYAANEWGGGRFGSGGTVDAISAVLAGLFGVQRALTAWLDKRQLAALYNKTRAQLKTAVYTFEQTWRHKVNAVSLSQFRAALEAATDTARNVVAAEQDQHYDIAAAPTFSLQDMLTSATGGAKALTPQLAAKETAQQQARREAEQTVREKDAQIQQLQALATRQLQALDRAQDDQRDALRTELNATTAQVRSAELARSLAMATITANAA